MKDTPESGTTPGLTRPDRPGIIRFRAIRWRFLILLVLAWIVFELATLPFGTIAELKTSRPGETAMMKERREALADEGVTLVIRQQWVPLRDIPVIARNAVIVAEDGTFWTHGGFDWFEFEESLRRNIRDRKISRGASTISQQLVKNLYLSSSKNPLRKIKEWILTWWMEQTLSKQRILELYLNVIEWGDGIYGIQAASYHYFGKPASDLSRNEAARLAAIIPSPRRFGSAPYSARVNRMTQVILERLAARNM